MKSLITITLGTLLAITSAFGSVTLFNDSPGAQNASVTVVTLTDFSGTTFQGNSTNGSFWETNTVTTTASATCANISLASGTVHVQLKGLNGNFPAFTPISTNQNLQLISKAGFNTVEFACFGSGWDIPATAAPSKSMRILSIVGAQQPGATKVDSTWCGPCQGATPMAGYRFHSLLASLSISDTPITYAPPVGTAIGFSVVYNQKEAYQPTNWTYSNLGPKWGV